ncbi:MULTISPECIES: hypothetical protein [Bartonella]|uniref:hypothetical protein n=1 Tax=Bartonella TaxID=773 RepID=UPI00235FE3B0|nr:hypothetical protein [Bartonella grahamii]
MQLIEREFTISIKQTFSFHNCLLIVNIEEFAEKNKANACLSIFLAVAPDSGNRTMQLPSKQPFDAIRVFIH